MLAVRALSSGCALHIAAYIHFAVQIIVHLCCEVYALRQRQQSRRARPENYSIFEAAEMDYK